METIYSYQSITKVGDIFHKINVSSLRKLDIKRLTSGLLNQYQYGSGNYRSSPFEEILIPVNSWKVDGMETAQLIGLREVDLKGEISICYSQFNVFGVMIHKHVNTVPASDYTPIYLLNAFSIQMLDNPYDKETSVKFKELEEDCVPNLDRLVSAIGHPDTAAVLGVPCNRIDVKLRSGDTAYVAQLMGGRLPEGSTVLPDGYRFKFFKVKIL